MPTLLTRSDRKKTSFNVHRFGYQSLGKIEEVELYLIEIAQFDFIRDSWKPNDSVETMYKPRRTS